jgi:hypothetical protein
VGLLTLDALDPEQFQPIELDSLQAFASLAAATVNAAERIERLAIAPRTNTSAPRSTVRPAASRAVK